MTACCICDVEIGSQSECISFHRFPKQDDKKLHWLTAISENIQNFTFTTDSKICSQHFTMDCFVVTCSGKRYLKSNVVPSIFNMPLKQGLEVIQSVPQQQTAEKCNNASTKKILVQTIRIPITIINSNDNKTDQANINSKKILTILNCVTNTDMQIPAYSGTSKSSSTSEKEDTTNLEQAKEYAATLKKKLKVSQQKCRRLQSRIIFLKLLARHLQKTQCNQNSKHQTEIKE